MKITTDNVAAALEAACKAVHGDPLGKVFDDEDVLHHALDLLGVSDIDERVRLVDRPLYLADVYDIAITQTWRELCALCGREQFMWERDIAAWPPLRARRIEVGLGGKWGDPLLCEGCQDSPFIRTLRSLT